MVLVIAHLLLLPVWILLWIAIPIAIWLDDRGPVFYPQRRIGKEGRPFQLLKFRTMVSNADNIGPGWTAETDERVTRVGRVLRRTALDELPQVVNIFRGDISLVGPRALPLKMHEEMTLEEPSFPLRLQIRPGLTGFAQLYLARHCSPRKRLHYDLLYIKKQSLWVDMKIVLLSVWLTLTGKWGTGSRKAEHTSKSYEQGV